MMRRVGGRAIKLMIIPTIIASQDMSIKLNSPRYYEQKAEHQFEITHESETENQLDISRGKFELFNYKQLKSPIGSYDATF